MLVILFIFSLICTVYSENTEEKVAVQSDVPTENLYKNAFKPPYFPSASVLPNLFNFNQQNRNFMPPPPPGMKTRNPTDLAKLSSPYHYHNYNFDCGKDHHDCHCDGNNNYGCNHCNSGWNEYCGYNNNNNCGCNNNNNCWCNDNNNCGCNNNNCGCNNNNDRYPYKYEYYNGPCSTKTVNEFPNTYQCGYPYFSFGKQLSVAPSMPNALQDAAQLAPSKMQPFQPLKSPGFPPSPFSQAELKIPDGIPQ